MEFSTPPRTRAYFRRKPRPPSASSSTGGADPSSTSAGSSGTVSPSESAGKLATFSRSLGRRRAGNSPASTPQQWRPRAATSPTSAPLLEFQFRPPTPMPDYTPQANQFRFPIPKIPTYVPLPGCLPQTPPQFSLFPQFSWRQPIHQILLEPAILRKKNECPADYGTKFDELCDGSRGFLLQIEAKIHEYREESERLGQCSRLHDIPTDYFELQSKRILQEVRGILTLVQKQEIPVQEMLSSARTTMRHVEVAVHSCMQLFHERNIAATCTASNFYEGIRRRPSTYMHEMSNRFENNLPELLKRIEEVEVILQVPSSSRWSIDSVPNVMSNLHQILIHVSAKVEEINQAVELKKKDYIASQCRMGNSVNPFLAADKREVALQKAAAERDVYKSFILIP